MSGLEQGNQNARAKLAELTDALDSIDGRFELTIDTMKQRGKEKLKENDEEWIRSILQLKKEQQDQAQGLNHADIEYFEETKSAIWDTKERLRVEKYRQISVQRGIGFMLEVAQGHSQGPHAIDKETSAIIATEMNGVIGRLKEEHETNSLEVSKFIGAWDTELNASMKVFTTRNDDMTERFLKEVADMETKRCESNAKLLKKIAEKRERADKIFDRGTAKKRQEIDTLQKVLSLSKKRTTPDTSEEEEEEEVAPRGTGKRTRFI